MDKRTHTYPDGAKYEGEWQDNKRHGSGIWIRSDGMKYEGEWANDKPNGQGTLTQPSGKERSGLWKEGKLIAEQQTVELKEDKVLELVISQKARIKELEETNQKLENKISALTNKLTEIEGQQVKNDSFNDAFATQFAGRTEENPLREKPVKSEKPVRKKTKVWWVVAAALLLLFVVIIANSGGEEEPASEVADIENTTPEPGSASEPSSDPALESVEGTLGEKNAAKSALNYLGTMPFSYSGLIEQLKFEGFTREEALYGVDRCGADWNEQAAKSAVHYLRTMPFSYSGLVKQLEFEGFTNAEAVYGVDRCGADWNEQAAKSAQNYLDTSSFSRTELIAQLEFEGFTRQQAEYGVQAVGY